MKDYFKDIETEQIQKLISFIQATIGEFRKIFMDLRPSILDELGVLATINWYSSEIQGKHPEIHIDQRIEIQEENIPPFLKVHIYRILQEALDNIVNHSQADKILISLSTEKKKRGFGIGSMKERSRITNGRFSLRSSEGRGTDMEISWPIE